MQSLDFSRFLDLGPSDAKSGLSPFDISPVEDIYPKGDGLLLQRPKGECKEIIQEIVRLAEGALLFASDHTSGCAPHSQLVTETDWVHIQLRLNGGGSERISETSTTVTPERSCVISRYPRNCIVERHVDATERWKAVCLLINPRGLMTLLDMPASALPCFARWLAQPGLLESRTQILPLQPAMMLAANDILSCPLRGPIRRTYMRAKALELLTAIISVLDWVPTAVNVRFTAVEMRNLLSARKIIESGLDNCFSLAELAEKVHLTRNRLAQLFKVVYGTTVAAYGRDLRLTRARTLLVEGRASATDVALEVGYANPSSFTRAFFRKFHVLPRDALSAAHLPEA